MCPILLKEKHKPKGDLLDIFGFGPDGDKFYILLVSNFPYLPQNFYIYQLYKKWKETF